MERLNEGTINELDLYRRVLRFRESLAAIESVDDFLSLLGDDGDESGDRAPLGPTPISPKLGAAALELV